jgi:hypothetical protein
MMAMSLLSLPLDAARTGTRLVLVASSVATLPARVTARLMLGAAESIIDVLEHSSVLEPSSPGAAAPRPRSAPTSAAVRNGVTVPPVRPAAVRAPGGKRRASTPGIPREADLSSPAPPPAPAGAPPPPPAPAPAGAAPPETDEAPLRDPQHVDAEATLVAESADPGAADGAGASVRVETPWPGYTRMTAAEIVDRLGAQEQAALTVLLLYERAHRRRRTVIDAAERELSRRAAAPSGS